MLQLGFLNPEHSLNTCSTGLEHTTLVLVNFPKTTYTEYFAELLLAYILSCAYSTGKRRFKAAKFSLSMTKAAEFEGSRESFNNKS